MKNDIIFVSALCKSKEKDLLGEERLNRMTECSSVDEGLRVLREANFGGDTEISTAGDFEKLIDYETEKLFSFLKEYVSGDFLCYATCENDFHNAQSVLRAEFLKLPLERLTVTEGLFKIKELKKAVENKDYSSLPQELSRAMKTAEESFENGTATGFNLSCVFTKALYEYKLRLAKLSKKLLVATEFEIDCKNVSVCLRSGDTETAKLMLLSGGNLKTEDYEILCGKDVDKIKNRFHSTKFEKYISLCLSQMGDNKPIVEFETLAESFTLKLFKDDRFFEIDTIDAVILYYLYKTYEIKNVRTVMVGLNVHLTAEQIKRRLKENYAG